MLWKQPRDDSSSLVAQRVARQIEGGKTVVQQQREDDCLRTLRADIGVMQREPQRGTMSLHPLREALLAIGRHWDALVAALPREYRRQHNIRNSHRLSDVNSPTVKLERPMWQHPLHLRLIVLLEHLEELLLAILLEAL
eukprot:CAMPEP_0117571340 /NCGR_PEP_ID=MMETSP0784-20121206/59696_1 /TAXON_ID=39447 /ORGANISM="" /LENGTH=138 /DNA_ID=CAMNT_0005369487 /DNA_START=287 /DNA_END=700 /DNA_ORIENTATION=-